MLCRHVVRRDDCAKILTRFFNIVKFKIKKKYLLEQELIFENIKEKCTKMLKI